MNDELKTALSKLASDALMVQDACNLSGVLMLVGQAREILNRVKHEVGGDTEWFNRHPIMILLSDKIASLTGSHCLSIFSRAYDECRKLSEDKR